jgi:hypothetical protein
MKVTTAHAARCDRLCCRYSKHASAVPTGFDVRNIAISLVQLKILATCLRHRQEAFPPVAYVAGPVDTPLPKIAIRGMLRLHDRYCVSTKSKPCQLMLGSTKVYHLGIVNEQVVRFGHVHCDFTYLSPRPTASSGPCSLLYFFLLRAHRTRWPQQLSWACNYCGEKLPE